MVSAVTTIKKENGDFCASLKFMNIFMSFCCCLLKVNGYEEKKKFLA